MRRQHLAVLACVACVTGAAEAAEALGRLFFAPAQRAQLDAARAQHDRRPPGAADTEQAAPRGPDVVTYSGMVRRDDGKSTVWINGKPITERTRDGDVSVVGVRRDGAVSVAVPQADRSASLRVGQSMEVTSGTIEESYARRATRYTPPAKPAPAGAAAAKRTVRRDTYEIDPDSGAAPLVERGAQK